MGPLERRQNSRACRLGLSTTTAARDRVQLECRRRGAGAAVDRRRERRGDPDLQGKLAAPGLRAVEQRFNAAVRGLTTLNCPYAAISSDSSTRTRSRRICRRARALRRLFGLGGLPLRRGLHLNAPRYQVPIVDLLLRKREPRRGCRARAPRGRSAPDRRPQTSSRGRSGRALQLLRPSGRTSALGQHSGSRTATARDRRRARLPKGYGVNVPFSSVHRHESTGVSDYHALTLGLTKRFSITISSSQLHLVARDRRLDRPADASRPAKQRPTRPRARKLLLRPAPSLRLLGSRPEPVPVERRWGLEEGPSRLHLRADCRAVVGAAVQHSLGRRYEPRLYEPD